MSGTSYCLCVLVVVILAIVEVVAAMFFLSEQNNSVGFHVLGVILGVIGTLAAVSLWQG